MRSYLRLMMFGVSVCVLGALFAGCKASMGSPSSENGTGILRAGLPPSAKLVSEGRAQLTYTPEEPGTLYLYDVTQDRKIGQFLVRRGQRFAMDGVAGRATLDGNELRISEPKKNDSFQIYFQADPMQ